MSRAAFIALLAIAWMRGTHVIFAQFPPVSDMAPPTLPGPALPQTAATAASSVTTLWDFLGARQLGSGVKQTFGVLHSMPAVRLVQRAVVHPVLQNTGLMPAAGGNGPNTAGSMGGPSVGGAASAGAGGGSGQAGAAVGPGAAGASEPPVAGGEQATPPPDPAALSKSIQAEQKSAGDQQRIDAIRFLGKQDCLAYPEAIDALLTSLDDPSELIRYEALKALHGGCRGGVCVNCPPSQTYVDSGIAYCRCRLDVIQRLSRLLLDRYPNGLLRERSVRVRHLAQLTLQRSLACTRPGDGTVVPQPRPDPPLQLPLN